MRNSTSTLKLKAHYNLILNDQGGDQGEERASAIQTNDAERYCLFFP